MTKAGVRDEVRREAIAAVAAARADLEEARARLAQTELRAPATGTIVRRLVEPGEQVTTMPPTVALKIADLDKVRLRAEIDESDVARVAPGAKAYATAEALGEKRLAGKVVRVERELGRKNIRTDDPRARVDTRVLEAIVVLDDPTPLPLGLRVDVHVAR
ncbi:MAG: efflux RND transporter periplasmic adaptor subunit [Labilithrix sp.]|nr:efflux RND transporter periplasmic adaptor subunit [Labilithrix sp.]